MALTTPTPVTSRYITRLRSVFQDEFGLVEAETARDNNKQKEIDRNREICREKGIIGSKVVKCA